MTAVDPHTPSADYGPGDIIASKYRLVSLVAEGGMGTVWVARNLLLDNDVAIKLIRRDLAHSQQAAKRLLTEARATAQIDHAGIVKVHDFGMDRGNNPFIVMELLKGETLYELMTRPGRPGALEPTYVVRIILPVLEALHVAHKQSIVHRDIKPENIFLVKSDTGDVMPKVLDFGIAKLRELALDTIAPLYAEGDSPEALREGVRRTVQGMTQAGDIVGSPGYLSPEQARCAPVDQRADLWAICVVMYEAMTEELPFDGHGLEELVMNLLVREPTPITQLGRGDDALWAILERGLAKRPADRWSSALELGKALAAWLASQGVATDITGRELARRWLGDASTLTTASVPPPASTPVSLAPAPPARPAGRRYAVLAGAAALFAVAVAVFVVRSGDAASAQPAADAAGEDTESTPPVAVVPAPPAPSDAPKPAARDEDGTVSEVVEAVPAPVPVRPAAPTPVGPRPVVAPKITKPAQPKPAKGTAGKGNDSGALPMPEVGDL